MPKRKTVTEKSYREAVAKFTAALDNLLRYLSEVPRG